jgi:hypothetical protein
MKKKIFILSGIILLAGLAFLSCEMGDIEQYIAIVPPYISVQPESHSIVVANYTTPPVLNVLVDDWNSNDGTLSYQWYNFNGINEFAAAGGNGTAINGATGAAFTPAGLSAAAGNKHYYYVEVTNTNNNASYGVTRLTVRSEVAIISFAASEAERFPIITRHPIGAVYPFGAEIRELTVGASLPGGDSSVLS